MPALRSKRSIQQAAGRGDNDGGDGGHEATDTTRSSKATPPPPKRSRGNGPHLSKLLKVYKGTDDWHMPIFRNVREYIAKQQQGHDDDGHQSSSTSIRTLYPGSSRHITASLVFDDVTYVDCDTKVRDFFGDSRVLEWVGEHKEYEAESNIEFLCRNFDGTLPNVPLASFDLLISACAGIVSTPCAKYLKPNGYLLVSDAHFDAREACCNTNVFQLVAALDMDGTMREDVEGHFTTTNGTPLTQAQVEESKAKPKARRSFQLIKEGMFYLFRKK